MLILFLQVLAALHVFGLVGLIAMMQMDRFDAIKRNLAIALLVTFASGTGLIILLEEMQPFIWDNTGNFKRKGKGNGAGGSEVEEGDGAGSGNTGDGGEADGAAAVGPMVRAKDVVKDCPQCPDMMVVPEGTIAMTELPKELRPRLAKGANKDEIPVASFLMARTDVTVDHYTVFAQATKHRMPPSCGARTASVTKISTGKPADGPPPRPALFCASSDDARAYAGWLTQVSGKLYRLPTPAELRHSDNIGIPPTPFHEQGFRIARDLDKAKP